MKELSTYKLECLKGTEKYVSQELLEKYPEVEILKESNTEISFSSNEEDIETFRNLYSPTHIEDSRGKVLNLSKRYWREGFVSAGINPSLAYILCMISKLKEEDILLDPFCGSSVIPITALKEFNIKRVICSDVSGKAIDASKKNFKCAKVKESKYMLLRSNIKDLKLSKKNIDVIISNLPFGIRVGGHEENIEIYSTLELLAKKVLRTKGSLVLLTQEKKLLREVFKKDYWDVKSELRVDEGGLLPEVFVIKRR